MDRDNKFSKIVQGIIKLEPDMYMSKAKLRVVGKVGYVDMHIATKALLAEDFDIAVEIMYGLWEKELKETVEVLTPQDTECDFYIVLSTEDLRMLIGQGVI